VQFGYGLNYLIDVEHAIIVDVEATPARTYDEVASTKTMLERTEQRLDLKPNWLAADTAYGIGKLLAWLLGKSITPHIPVWERYPSSDGMFSRSDFTYDAERDLYVCPNGRPLRTSGTVHDGRVRNYLSQPQDCRACTLKQRCTRAPFKKIARDINEDARNHARSLKGTPEFERSSKARKKVEMRFAHLKVQHGFERMRLRGLTGAPRRVPPRRHCAESQDNGAAPRPPANRRGVRVDCVEAWQLGCRVRRSGCDAQQKKAENAPLRVKPTTAGHFSTASARLRHASRF
jgi:hypothetical protein